VSNFNFSFNSNLLLPLTFASLSLASAAMTSIGSLGSDPIGFDMTSRGCVLDGDLRHRLSNLEALQALGLGLKLGRTPSSSPHMRSSQFGES